MVGTNVNCLKTAFTANELGKIQSTFPSWTVRSTERLTIYFQFSISVNAFEISAGQSPNCKA
jgi:hypothetical protein